MVDTVTSIALSGLRASEKRIQVAADNIANVSTPNYKTAAVQQTSLAQGGVTSDVVKTEAPVDIAEQLVNSNVASYDFKANLKVLQAQRDLSKHLFDIQA